MEQVLLIVWRECVEALLVVGILHAWLSLGNRTARRGLVYLRSGVAVGAIISLVLAWALVAFGDGLSGNAQTCFQIVMLLAAGVLIVHMVFWMHRHGRTLKQEIKMVLEQSNATGRWWGVFILALTAVAREGSEMVVFVYGISVSQHMGAATIAMEVAAGLLMAYATFYLVQVSGKLFSWKRFFQVTEIILLFLAAGLFVSGVERLFDLLLENNDWPYSYPWFMSLTQQAWDTSGIVSDSSTWGNLWSTLVGYRAKPTICNVLTMLVFWCVIGVAMWRMAWFSRRHPL